MKISVAMAAFRGENFIEEQLRSILAQLREGDEIIVSDDEPGGETEAIVRRMAEADSRIQYVKGPGQGVIRNFSHAISLTSGDIIFLADQDDVWLPGKVDTCVAALNTCDLVLHDAQVVDANLVETEPSFFGVHGSKPGFWQNLVRNSYMGCCMAFKASLKADILPIPSYVPMHDQWIGLVAEQKGSVCFLPKQLIQYRVHGGNVTGRATSLTEKIGWRVDIAHALFSPCRRKSEVSSASGNGVSACIVTYNNEDKIYDAVRSMLDNVKAKDFTLYIVDNGSSDNTLSIIKSSFGDDPRVFLMETYANDGFGAGHNKVIPLLNSKYHCVVNPDIILDSDVVSMMAGYMDTHADVVQLSPRIQFPDGTDQVLGKRIPHLPYLLISHFRDKNGAPNVVMRHYAMLGKYDRGLPFKIRNATGCFMLFRTDVFKELGGFDPRYFMYFEDCDITREMNKKGTVLFYPEAVVYHAWERGSSSNKKLKIIHIQSMLKYYVKWYGGPLAPLGTFILKKFDVRP